MGSDEAHYLLGNGIQFLNHGSAIIIGQNYCLSFAFSHIVLLIDFCFQDLVFFAVKNPPVPE